MNFEALLLGLEPVTALTVGIAAVVLTPVVNAIGTVVGNSNLGESLSESAREVTKQGLVWGFEALENAKAVSAQAEEAFKDILADAKLEHLEKKSQSVTSDAQPQEIEIVSQ